MPFAHRNVTWTKRDRLFKMALKMQTDDENEYHIRSALSNTGIPTEHHRTMGCVLLMSNAITFGKLIYSRARSPVGKS